MFVRPAAAPFARLVAALALVVLALLCVGPAAARTPAGPRYLVVYADDGGYGRLGEIYAVFTANLLGRFGRSDVRAASAYRPGEAEAYDAVAWVGASYGATVPEDFAQDVLASERPVLWMQHGIDQLARAAPGFGDRFGWTPSGYAAEPRTLVSYKGRVFGRKLATAEALPRVRVGDPERAQVLATAEGEGAEPLPWAVRSGRFLYVAEAPFAFMDEDDRYVAFAGLLMDWIAPQTPVSRRALVRIEDVGPEADPVRLRAIADRLYREGVPFSVTVYDTYRDPGGRFSGGRPRSFTLRDRPEVVRALRYMQASGGTLVMHGHTHQTDLRPNPFARVSGGDYEFFGAVEKPDGGMALAGALPGDDEAAWLTRIDAGLKGWAEAGLSRPLMFTTPHYAASTAAYRAIARRFPVRYEQVEYFPGELDGRPDLNAPYGQFFPYPVRDVRGAVIVPENLGRPAPDQGAAGGRTTAQVVASAERNLVIREAYASFYRHWYLDPDELVATVRQVRALGYEFVPSQTVAEELAGPLVAPAPPARTGGGLSLPAFLTVLGGCLVGAVALGAWCGRAALRRALSRRRARPRKVAPRRAARPLRRKVAAPAPLDSRDRRLRLEEVCVNRPRGGRTHAEGAEHERTG